MQSGIGLLDAQAQDRRDPAGRRQPNARYRKYTATVGYLQPFSLWGESFSFQQFGHRPTNPLFRRSA